MEIAGEAQGFDVMDGAGFIVGVADQFVFPAADQSTARPACCGNAEGVGTIGRDGCRGCEKDGVLIFEDAGWSGAKELSE